MGKASGKILLVALTLVMTSNVYGQQTKVLCADPSGHVHTGAEKYTSDEQGVPTAGDSKTTNTIIGAPSTPGTGTSGVTPTGGLTQSVTSDTRITSGGPAATGGGGTSTSGDPTEVDTVELTSPNTLGGPPGVIVHTAGGGTVTLPSAPGTPGTPPPTTPSSGGGPCVEVGCPPCAANETCGPAGYPLYLPLVGSICVRSCVAKNPPPMPSPRPSPSPVITEPVTLGSKASNREQRDFSEAKAQWRKIDEDSESGNLGFDTSLDSIEGSQVAGVDTGSSNLQMQLQGYTGGQWWYTFFPTLLWNLNPTHVGAELTAYTVLGERMIYERMPNGHYRKVRIEDPHGNAKIFFYDQNGRISQIRNDQVERVYTRTTSGGGRTLTIKTQVCADSSCQNTTIIPELEEELKYDAQGRIISYTGAEKPSVAGGSASPLSLNGTTPTLGRLKINYSYANGLPHTIQLEGPHETKNAVSYAWESSGAPGNVVWRVRSVTTMDGGVINFTYESSQGIYRRVIATNASNRRKFTYNWQNQLIEVVTEPLENLASTPNYPDEKITLGYLIPGYESCSLISYWKNETTLKQWQGEYDTYYRLVREYNTSAKATTQNASQMLDRSYEYEDILAASLPRKVTDEAGNVTEISNSFISQNDPHDARLKPISSTTTQSVSSPNGSAPYTLSSVERWNDKGQVVFEREPNGTVTEYRYGGPLDATNRGLVTSALSGPPDASGMVDKSNSATTSALFKRSAPLGSITDLYQGAHGSEHMVMERDYDSSGRISEERKGTATTRYYYDQYDNLVSSHELNLDYSGQAHKSPINNMSLGGKWRRTDMVYVDWLLRAVISDSNRAPYAPDGGSNLTNYDIYRFDYDSMGRIVRTTDSLGVVHTTNFNGFGRSYQEGLEVNGAGTMLREFLESPNQLTVRSLARESGPASLEYTTSKFSINPAGLIEKAILPNGQQVRLNRDNLGQVLSIKRLKGTNVLEHVSMQYNSVGQPASRSIISPLSGAATRIWGAEYGPSGIREELDQFGTSARYGYNGAGEVSSVTSKGVTTWYDYEAGDLTRIRIKTAVNEERHMALEYDAQGQVTKTMQLGLGGSAAPLVTQYFYGSRGDLGKTILPDGTAIFYTQGSDGFIWAERRNKLVKQAHRQVDATLHEKLVTLIDEAGVQTSITSGPFGLTKLSVPGRDVLQVGYDGAFNRTNYTWGSRTVQSSYDSLGRVYKHEVRLPNGVTTIMEQKRDQYDRLFQGVVQDASGTRTVTRGYDEYNNIKSETIDTPFGPRTTQYGRGNPYDFTHYHTAKLLENGGLTLKYNYDANDLVESMEFLNAPNGVSSPLASFTYNGTTLSSQSAGGVDTTVGYDTYGLLESVEARVGGNQVYLMQHERDQLGRVTKSIRQVGMTPGIGSMYEYDEEGRLTGLKDPQNLSQFNQPFDAVTPTRREVKIKYNSKHPSKRESLTVTGSPGAQVKSYTVDANGQYNSFNGSSIVTNGLGQITQAHGRNYVYNELGKLAEVRSSSNQALQQFSYDPSGRLLSMQGAQGQKTPRWIGFDRIALESSAGLDSIEVLEPYVIDESIATYRKQGTNYSGYGVVSENMSPHGVVLESSGQLLEGYVYNPDGERIVYLAGSNTPQSSSSIGMLGGMHWMFMSDELSYVRERIYDPKVGGFLTADPRSPFGLNYPLDPINFRDPFGLQPMGGFARMRRLVDDIAEIGNKISDVVDGAVGGVKSTWNWADDTIQAGVDKVFNNTAVGTAYKEANGTIVDVMDTYPGVVGNSVTPGMLGSLSPFSPLIAPLMEDYVRSEAQRHENEGISSGDAVDVVLMAAGPVTKGAGLLSKTGKVGKLFSRFFGWGGKFKGAIAKLFGIGAKEAAEAKKVATAVDVCCEVVPAKVVKKGFSIVNPFLDMRANPLFAKFNRDLAAINMPVYGASGEIIGVEGGRNAAKAALSELHKLRYNMVPNSELNVAAVDLMHEIMKRMGTCSREARYEYAKIYVKALRMTKWVDYMQN
jgi:YD repeat-containing protein